MEVSSPGAAWVVMDGWVCMKLFSAWIIRVGRAWLEGSLPWLLRYLTPQLKVPPLRFSIYCCAVEGVALRSTRSAPLTLSCPLSVDRYGFSTHYYCQPPVVTWCVLAECWALEINVSIPNLRRPRVKAARHRGSPRYLAWTLLRLLDFVRDVEGSHRLPTWTCPIPVGLAGFPITESLRLLCRIRYLGPHFDVQSKYAVPTPGCLHPPACYTRYQQSRCPGNRRIGTFAFHRAGIAPHCSDKCDLWLMLLPRLGSSTINSPRPPPKPPATRPISADSCCA